MLNIPYSRPAGLRALSMPIRCAMINEAIKFKSGPSTTQKMYTPIYRVNDIILKFGKPGKEVNLGTINYANGSHGSNPNDMTPTYFRGMTAIVNDGSFQDVFRKFQMMLPSTRALELVGALMVRNAYCLDHIQNHEGGWRYQVNERVIQQIVAFLPRHYQEDIRPFLYYLDLIAWNEDVKYSTIGYDISKGVGRENNLLTYAHLIGVLINKVDFIKFAGGLTRQPAGINPISLKMALEIYPELRPHI